MLTEEEKKEIQEEIKQYPYPAVACIDALKIIQQRRGWVSDESIKDIAQILGISNEDVDGVATFYSRIYRKPVGRNVILICDSISCMIMGYESIYAYIPNSCLGDCDHAPAMMINNDHYNNLTVEKIDELLGNYK